MQRIFFGLICALVVGIYIWTAEPGALEFLSPRPQDAYYNLLVQGFQSEQLNVKREPAPGLAKLSDPYNPTANKPYVWDTGHLAYEMSYYKGKLYLYFGISPALVLFWPYAALTGHYLDHKDATVIFFAAGFIFAAVILWGIWRHHFPDANAGAAAAGLLAVGLASGILEMFSSCGIYEIAKGCAFAFSMLALAAIWRALREPKEQIKYVALASLAYGLAIGSRPSLLFGAILLLVPLARAWRLAGQRLDRQTVLLAVAAVTPVTLIVLGLMLYNDLRFDNPFEFGWHYQMTSFQNHGARQFSLGYLWYNFHFYFLDPMHWTEQFPFLKPVETSPSPVGYNGTGTGYCGILVDYPIAWLALAAPLAWRGNSNETIQDLRWFAWAIFLFFLASATTLCLFFASGSNYESDFLPALMLLAAFGIFGVEHALAGLPAWRWAARCAWSLLLVFSLVVNFLASAEAHAISRYLAGNFLVSEDRLDEAATQFRRVLAIQPEYAGAWCGLGNVLLKQGQLDQAILNYEKAIEFDPSVAEAVNNLGYCFFLQGRINDAIVQYQKVLQSQPDYAQARNNLANCFLRMNRTDDAIAQYEEAVELDPGSATYQCGLGNAFLQKGQTADAIAQYQKALEIQPDFAAAHNYLAYCLFRTGQMSDAISQYRQAVELDPKSAVFHGDLANALLQKGDAPAAIAEYQNSLALQPQSAEARKRLGDALFQNGELDAAIGQYQKALELNAEFPEALNNLGYCYLLENRADDAIALFQRLAKLKPDLAPAYNSLGDAYRRKGMASQAIAGFEKAIELQPDFGLAQKNLAWMLATWPDASIRNGTKAVAFASKANQQSGGSDPEILRILAAAYAETGDFGKALDTAQKAISLTGSKKDLAGKLQNEIRLYQNHTPCRTKDN